MFTPPIREALLNKQLHIVFIYGAFTLWGIPFQETLTRDLGVYAHHISSTLSSKDSVCPVPFSLAANKGIINLFSFPAGTKMFQFPAFASLSRFQLFSDSEISGSMLACSSPELFAACHVLNHSPNQAIHLTECKIYFPFFLSHIYYYVFFLLAHSLIISFKILSRVCSPRPTCFIDYYSLHDKLSFGNSPSWYFSSSLNFKFYFEYDFVILLFCFVLITKILGLLLLRRVFSQRPISD